MSCAQFSSTSPACRTVTLIEPDQTLLSATSAGSVDESLEEVGSFTLVPNKTLVHIDFNTVKAGPDYRFEYLYVSTLGNDTPTNIQAIPILQTAFGFSVRLTGGAIQDNYVLRWRVVVIEFGIAGVLDKPETIYRVLPLHGAAMTVVLVNPRSTIDYHFTELRVENLTDPLAAQSRIHVQVVHKAKGSFRIGINPTAPTLNYYLAAMTA